MRTIYRDLTYKSSWDLGGVLQRLEQMKITPEKVVRALILLHRYNVPSERIGGSLVVVFNMEKERSSCRA